MNTKNNNEQNHTNEAKNEIEKMAKLAFKILNKDKIAYKRNKEAIKGIFESQKSKTYKTQVEVRLIIIDNYYSTNMSKNLYGIESLALKIGKILSNDNQLKEMFKKFLKNPSNNTVIYELFEPKDKYGVSEKRAYSLISKYAYFLLDYHFPIYDRLARMSYNILKNYYKDLTLPSRGDSINKYFIAIKELNKFIHNYEKLDNLLWLLGKIHESRYSYIIIKEKYLKLKKIVDNLNLKMNNVIKFEDFYNQVELNNCFDNELILMIHYLAKIKKITN